MSFDQNFLDPNFNKGSTEVINSEDSKMASYDSANANKAQMAPSSIPSTIKNLPDIVRIGETIDEPIRSLKGGCSGSDFSKKRKQMDFSDKARKVHLTEEIMAEQMKNMHISNKYCHNQGFRKNWDEPGESLLPTLVLSKEVQSLSAFVEPSLPDLFLPKLDVPTQALVLWEPPASKLPPLTWHLEEKEKDLTNNNDSANNAPDLNLSRLTSQTAVTEMEL